MSLTMARRRKPLHTKICEGCGESFVRDRHTGEAAWQRRRFCRESCYKSHKRANAKRPISHTSAARQREWRAENLERVRARQADYRAKNRDRVKAWQAEWRARNPEALEAISRRRLLKRYGLSEAEFASRMEEQQGRCAICVRHVTSLSFPKRRTRRRLDIDHCHRSSRVRGLLCFNCNAILGNANDSLAVLRAAIEYLERFQ